MSTLLFILGSFETLSPTRQNSLPVVQTAHGRKTTRVSGIDAPIARAVHREHPEIYLINPEHAKSASSKKLQSLEHDLYRLCAATDRATTKGKIEASKGKLANRIFSGELKLIGFPSGAGDFVVDLRCGVAEFYSVNKVTKCLNKRCRLSNAALLNAVFCNVMYFPCYVDIKTMKMKFIKEDTIEFSGNVTNDLSQK